MTALRHYLTHWSPVQRRSRGCPRCAHRLADVQPSLPMQAVAALLIAAVLVCIALWVLSTG